MSSRTRGFSVLGKLSLLWLLVLARFLAPAVHAAASGERVPIGPPTSKSYIEVREIFSLSPALGFAPLKITVNNASDQPMTFHATSTTRAHTSEGQDITKSEISFTAPKQKASTHTLIVPVCMHPGANNSHYGSGRGALELEFSGATSFPFYSAGGLSSGPASVAASKVLTAGNVNTLNTSTHSSGHGSVLRFSEFDPLDLPEDWRAYSGFAFLSITGTEWLTLSQPVRTSIRQWVELGGELRIYGNGLTYEAMQIPLPHGRFGLGNVQLVLVPPTTSFSSSLGTSNFPMQDDERSLIAREASNPRQTNNPKASEPQDQWGMLHNFLGIRSFAAWQIGLILIAFGLLVGPINLFHFAKAGRRHRLFFTTPIISLGASGLLILYILFQDGIGGTGARCSIVHVDPPSASLSIQQDQISRTGVLFGSAFTTDEAALVLPVVLPDSRWTRLKHLSDHGYGHYSRNSSQGQSYSQMDPKSFAGDWFQSRSEQAQRIQMLRSSRGRMELTSKPGTPVMLQSSFAYTLDFVFYVDENNEAWLSTAPVKTGATAQLQKSSSLEFIGLLTKHGLHHHASVKRIINQPSKHHFYSVSTAPNAEFIASLSSIDWQNQVSFIWGQVITAP